MILRDLVLSLVDASDFLPPGQQTLRLELDSGDDIAESNETNNIKERTFTVQSSNLAPIANAGPSQTVSSGEVVTLSGTASDPDGDSLTFEWNQLQGPVVTLATPDQSTTNFNAPVTDQSITLGFRLTVQDGRGGVGSEARKRCTAKVWRSP